VSGGRANFHIQNEAKLYLCKLFQGSVYMTPISTKSATLFMCSLAVHVAYTTTAIWVLENRKLSKTGWWFWQFQKLLRFKHILDV